MKVAKYTKWIGSAVLLMAVMVPYAQAACSEKLCPCPWDPDCACRFVPSTAPNM